MMPKSWFVAIILLTSPPVTLSMKWRGVHPEGIHPEGEIGGEVFL
jgi:hypothetical protein